MAWKTPSCICSCQLCIKSEVCCGTVGHCGDGWKLQRIAVEARNMMENALSILIVFFSAELQQTEISERKLFIFHLDLHTLDFLAMRKLTNLQIWWWIRTFLRATTSTFCRRLNQRPGGKSIHFWKIYISAKTAEFVIWIPKSVILCREWGNIKELNKYPRVILNMRWRGGQKRNSFLFCSNSQHDRS